jgi:hypothetical protein
MVLLLRLLVGLRYLRRPTRAPAADWLRPRFNAFEPQEPAVGVVADFWEKFFDGCLYRWR